MWNGKLDANIHFLDFHRATEEVERPHYLCGLRQALTSLYLVSKIGISLLNILSFINKMCHGFLEAIGNVELERNTVLGCSYLRLFFLNHRYPQILELCEQWKKKKLLYIFTTFKEECLPWLFAMVKVTNVGLLFSMHSPGDDHCLVMVSSSQEESVISGLEWLHIPSSFFAIFPIPSVGWMMPNWEYDRHSYGTWILGDWKQCPEQRN